MAAGLLLAGAAACGGGGSSDPTSAAYVLAAPLAGTWRWVSSRDVRTGAVHTRGTAGYGAALTFASDARTAGAFTYARPGRLPVRGRFEVAWEHAPGADFVVLAPGVDYLSRNAWLTVGRDTLRLGGVMELGHNSVYARSAP